MNPKTLSLLKAVCAILVGTLLIASPREYALIAVRVIGGLLLVSALVPVINDLSGNSTGPILRIVPFLRGGSVLLGILLLINPEFFVRAIMYILAVLFLMGGLQHGMRYTQARDGAPMRWGSVLFAWVFVLLGILVLVYPLQSASVPFILLGTGLILYGCIEVWRVLKHISWERKDGHEDEYVDYEDVTDDDTMRK